GGLAGISVLPGVAMSYDGVVQAPGTAVRVNAALLADEGRQSAVVQEGLGHYAWAVLADSIQTAACNNFHNVDQRCARWLLMMHDVAGRDEFAITHDLLARMLGVRRATATKGAQDLQRSGAIAYTHGHLHVRDRKCLEDAACECYRDMRERRRELLG